ncbi:hypothetical protein A2U01_0077175, partial [Trifolium medium]|nr:hypothetical protein [Trifolium medium]
STDFEDDEGVAETLKSKEEAHPEEEDKGEDQEKLLVEIEMHRRDVIEKEEAMKETLNVRNGDFYKAAEPQPMKIQDEDLQQREHPSNRAEEKS